MIRWIGLLLSLVLLLVATSARAATEPPVLVNGLIEKAREFDGHVVTVEGEVIGDVMIRGEYGWINVTDGTNDIGIWAPAAALRSIRYAGRYHQTGDRVRVTGEFRRADPEHGGDLVLRAAALDVLEAGAPVAHPVPAGRPLLAAIALAVAGFLGYLRWRRQLSA